MLQHARIESKRLRSTITVYNKYHYNYESTGYIHGQMQTRTQIQAHRNIEIHEKETTQRAIGNVCT